MWTSSKATPGPGLGAAESRINPTWIPDPANPSTPWVADVATITPAASRGPMRVTSQ